MEKLKQALIRNSTSPFTFKGGKIGKSQLDEKG